MPIPRERFDKGQEDQSYNVLKFLADNPDKAFEVSEISKALYGSKPAGRMGEVLFENVAAVVDTGIILDDLAHEGKVDRKLIGVKCYYTVHRSSGCD